MGACAKTPLKLPRAEVREIPTELTRPPEGPSASEDQIETQAGVLLLV